MSNIHGLLSKYNPTKSVQDITNAYWDIYSFMQSLMYEGTDKIREKQGYSLDSPFSHSYECVAMSGSYLDTFETRLNKFLRETCIKYNLVCPPIHAKNTFNNGSMTIGFEFD